MSHKDRKPNVMARRAVIFMLGVLAACSSVDRAHAQPLIITGGSVHPADGPPFEPGEILIVDGFVVAVGASVERTPDARIIELMPGQRVYPGLIAICTSLGLAEINAVRATDDTTEVGGFTPDVEAWIAVNPDSELIAVARAGGITRFEAAPLGGIVAGQSALLATVGWTTESMVATAPAALHVVWPSMALDLRPRRRGDVDDAEEKERKSPEEQAREREQSLRELEEFFQEAISYHAARAARPEQVDVDPSWAAMRPFIDGERPILVRAREHRQILAVLDWQTRLRAQSSKIRLVIAGGRDAYRSSAALATAGIGVVFESVFEVPERRTDAVDVHYRAPAVLHEAGVAVALAPGAGSWNAAILRNLPHHAAQAAAHGLPVAAAVAAITSMPARLLGVDDRFGTIAPGLVADLIVTDGDLLDLRAPIARMWIAGVEVSLESRHTRLFERYRNRPR